MPNLSFALRSLLKTPGYTTIALITLALGIGVNTAMFSLVNSLLFRSGPFPHPEELVQVSRITRQGNTREFSEQELREIRAHLESFASVTTIGRTFYSIAEPGRPAERLNGITASAELFATFGIPPMLGRAFTAEETRPGNNHVVLLSYSFWQQRYGGSQDVVGRTLRLDGETVTIIGVMPASFEYHLLWGHPALWRPLNFTPDQMTYRDYRAFQLTGRLKPGATPEQVAAGLAPLASVQEKEHPESYPALRYRAIPLTEALMDDLGRQISWMLIGVAGFILLIACANLANLQLARATAGMRDIAIRAALGASRGQLILQQLAECVLLSLAGGGLGLIVALWINNVLERSILIDGAPGLEIPLEGSILALTLGLALLTGVLFGLVPAWLASRTDVSTAMKQQSRGSTAGRGHHRMRHALIVGEVALALVLLGGAGIMQRGFARLLERASGWDTTKILTGSIPIPENRFDNGEKRIEFFRRLEARLIALPGVEHAALATSVPLFGYSGERPVLIDGQSPGAAANLPLASHVMITHDYFATLGIPLIEGRAFAADIKESSPHVVLVNETLARHLWPGRSAVGQRLGSIDSGKPDWSEVIGVVRDVEAAANVGNPNTTYQVYRPLVQEPWSYVNLIVRGPQPATLLASVRRAVTEVDPDLSVEQLGTVPQIVDQQQHNLRLVAKTLTAFALLGVVLAAIGLYGVISNIVAQRSGEFGIRLALGARPVDVLGLVLGQGLRLIFIGLVLGLGGAYGLGRLLASWMPRLASPDPATLLGVALLLFGVAFFACWLPARRATKVDPMTALRAE